MSEDAFEVASVGDLSMEVSVRAADTAAIVPVTDGGGRSLNLRVPFSVAQDLARNLRAILDQYPDGTIPMMMSGTREG